VLEQQQAKQTASRVFEDAQRAVWSEAATSLAQMSARAANGDAKSAHLARERQDLAAEWSRLDNQLMNVHALASSQRNRSSERELSVRLEEVGKRISEIDTALLRDFPEFAAFAASTPISLDDVQANLKSDEALLFFLETPNWKFTPEEGFLWVVTKA